MPLLFAGGDSRLGKHALTTPLADFRPFFVHPFPTLHPLCLGIGWAFSDDSHLLSTLSPSFPPCLGIGWELPGFSHLSTALSHPSPTLPGHWVGSAWLLPPFAHPSPTHAWGKNGALQQKRRRKTPQAFFTVPSFFTY